LKLGIPLPSPYGDTSPTPPLRELRGGKDKVDKKKNPRTMPESKYREFLIFTIKYYLL
jgi:hypothetical protein